LESNWRRNVFELGWQDGPYGLIARLPGVFFNFAIASHLVPDGFYTPLHFVSSLGTWVAGPVVAIPSTAPHFPYGVSVNPD
jgi:hypothetical protein